MVEYGFWQNFLKVLLCGHKIYTLVNVLPIFLSVISIFFTPWLLCQHSAWFSENSCFYKFGNVYLVWNIACNLLYVLGCVMIFINKSFHVKSRCVNVRYGSPKRFKQKMRLKCSSCKGFAPSLQSLVHSPLSSLRIPQFPVPSLDRSKSELPTLKVCGACEVRLWWVVKTSFRVNFRSSWRECFALYYLRYFAKHLEL